MSKNSIRILAVSLLMLVFSGIMSAQSLQMKVMSWNVLSFEQTDKSGERNGFPVAEYVTLIKNENPDIVCLNEFETGTERMGKEKMSELAEQLGMYAYYIMSYPKGAGFYGNVILSKYPILNVASKLHPYEHAKGEGNYQWNTGDLAIKYGTDQRSVGYADILVPVSDTESKTIRIVCSHFEAYVDTGSWTDGEKVRNNQAKVSVEFASLNNPPYPTLMFGDLNTTSSETLSPIFDCGERVGLSWVDYVISFPKGAWTKVSSGSVSCGKLSDHSPLVAVVTLN